MNNLLALVALVLSTFTSGEANLENEFGDQHDEVHGLLLRSGQPNYACMLSCVTTAAPVVLLTTPPQPEDKVWTTAPPEDAVCSDQQPRQLSQLCQKKVPPILSLVQVGYSRFYFSLSNQLLSWHGALKWCRVRGLQLGVLDSASKERDLAYYLSTLNDGAGSVPTWLGGSDHASRGKSHIWVDLAAPVTDARATKSPQVEPKTTKGAKILVNVKPAACLGVSSWTSSKAVWAEDTCTKPKAFFCDVPQKCFIENCVCPSYPEYVCLPQAALSCCKSRVTAMFSAALQGKCNSPNVRYEELQMVSQLYIAYSGKSSEAASVGDNATAPANASAPAAPALKSFKDSGYNFGKLLWIAECFFKQQNLTANQSVAMQAVEAHVASMVNSELRPIVKVVVARCAASIQAYYKDETIEVFYGRERARTLPFLTMMCVRRNMLLECSDKFRTEPKDFKKCQDAVQKNDPFPPVPVIPTTAKNVSAADFAKIPMDWYNLGSKNYFFNRKTRGTWSQAVQLCLKYNLTIVSIETKEEDDFISQFIKDIWRVEDFWMGANDLRSEGKFVWTATKMPLTYSHWFAQEPDNGGGNNHPVQNCVFISTWTGTTPKWLDSPCSDQLFCICEQ